MTVILSLLAFPISVLLMSWGMEMGGIIIGVIGAVFPVGIYEIYLGRTKYRNLLLKEYSEKFENNKEGRVYGVLGIVGAILGGSMSGYFDRIFHL